MTEQVSASAADAPGPSSDEFDPNQHVWDGSVWWSLDRARWWDGARWQGAKGEDHDLYLHWLAWVRSNLGGHYNLAPIATAAAVKGGHEGGGAAKDAGVAQAPLAQSCTRFCPRHRRVA